MKISGNSHTYSKYTYRLNLNKDLDGEWFRGLDLIEGREDHAAESVTDEITKENFVVVDSTIFLYKGFFSRGFQPPINTYVHQIISPEKSKRLKF